MRTTRLAVLAARTDREPRPMRRRPASKRALTLHAAEQVNRTRRPRESTVRNRWRDAMSNETRVAPTVARIGASPVLVPNAAIPG